MPSQFKTIYTATSGTELQASPSEWSLISLTLDTAGPVVAGTLAELTPISSGRGLYLSDKPRYYILSPSERLYTAADSVNRISMGIHPLPNFVQVIMKLDALLGALARKFGF